MLLARSNCAIVLLTGSILVVGGQGRRTYTDTTEALSLQTMTFAAGPAMLAVRSGCAALALPQDHSPRHALVVGGRDMPSHLSTTEVLTAAS